MSLPASQSFTNLQGSLGTGSVTFDGLTFFSDDASAVISVTADHHLSFGTSTGTHVVGYKTADGSNFSPSGGNGLDSFSVYTLGSYVVELFRDGVLVGSSAFTTTTPSYADVSFLSANIDEIRLPIRTTT